MILVDLDKVGIRHGDRVLFDDLSLTLATGDRVGVVGLNDGDRGPLTVPIWYDYEPGGEIWFITGAGSRKGLLLKEGTRLSMAAQTDKDVNLSVFIILPPKRRAPP